MKLGEIFTKKMREAYKKMIDDAEQKYDRSVSNGHPSQYPLIAAQYVARYDSAERDYGLPAVPEDSKQTVLIGFGQNESQELGIIVPEDPVAAAHLAALKPRVLEKPSKIQCIRSIAAGANFNLLSTHDGKVFSFGTNDMGQLGRPTGKAEMKKLKDEYDQLDMLENKTDAQRNRMGQLDKLIELREKVNAELECDPAQVTGFMPSDGIVEDELIRTVAAGNGSFGLCLSIRGNVYFMGAFRDSSEGSKMLNPSTGLGIVEKPFHIKLGQPAVSVTASLNGCYIILADGSCVSFGLDTVGELCHGQDQDFEHRGEILDLKESLYKKRNADGDLKYDPGLILKNLMTPKPIVFSPLDSQKIVAVSSKSDHVLATAIDSSGFARLYTAGSNGYGQLGHGDLNFRHSLTLVGALKTKCIGQIATGGDSSYAVDFTGFPVYGFGSNSDCQLGIKPKKCVDTPTVIPFEKNIIVQEICAGERHCFVRTTKGELYSWGRSSEGALGWMTDELVVHPTKLPLEGKTSLENKNFAIHSIASGMHTIVSATIDK